MVNVNPVDEYDKWKCFRVTMDDDVKIVQICRGTSALVCKEEADADDKATHYHLLVYTTLKTRSLRQRVYEALGDVPNKSKKCAFTRRKDDLEPYKRYICKGLSHCADPQDPDYPKIILNDNGDNIQRLHDEYWAYHARLKAGRKADKEETQSRSVEFYKYFDNFMAELDARDWLYVPRTAREQPCAETLTLETAALHCIRWFASKEYPMPSKYHLQQMALTVYAKHRAPGNHKEQALLEFYGMAPRVWG